MSALARKIHSAELEQVTLETPEPVPASPRPLSLESRRRTRGSDSAKTPRHPSPIATMTRSHLELTAQDLVLMFRNEPRTMELEAGQVLFKNGDRGGSMYIVMSGILTIRSGSIVY